MAVMNPTPPRPAGVAPTPPHPAGPASPAPGGAHTATGHTHRSDDQAELLDLEAEVLAEHLASLTAWLPVDEEPRRIVDLGCGTGAGTFALLARFPEAEVTAVDSSAVHLDRLRERAEALGVAGRVRVVRADLDAGRPELGRPELAWASSAMHHLADPGRVLRRVRELLAPGGLFALVEPAGFPRFLPEDAPEDRPGLEERCHTALADHHAEQVPHRGADWGPGLAAAGFTVVGERVVTVHVDRSHGPAVGRYALSGLRRLRGAAARALPAEDLAALDRLLDSEDPRGIGRRGDLAVRTELTAWAARRP
ncbi:hypothetical protein GCM10010274_54500 [Streptomyces lavendofoliae]|uniref:Methyltransferase type 12 domain-containing protein n=2 Tax=Streptomyces lavendofoliae TaxID=67314 RepID=A0A918I1Q6_9ACTN|nr:hypothetical protein GCM10010274_54500 [Streptomyces lavendofoliae]